MKMSPAAVKADGGAVAGVGMARVREELAGEEAKMPLSEGRREYVVPDNMAAGPPGERDAPLGRR